MLPQPVAPRQEMCMNGITQEEFQAAVRHSRPKSAPGPNGIVYRVYKNCPQVRKVLYQLFCRVWRQQQVPAAWQCAKIALVPKMENSKDVTEFRPIALTNVEGKLFFSIMQRRIVEYLMDNDYLRNQKGFLPKVSGCLEHNVLVAEALKDARKYKRAITVTWIDMVNAFGSPRHSLLFFAMEHYRVPIEMQTIFQTYYRNLTAMVWTKEWTTQPFHIQKGMFQGCTASPVLFNMVMQLAIDTLQHHHETCAYVFGAGPARALLSAFADDLQVVTKSRAGNQMMLDTFQNFVTWTETMRPNPAKCVCLSYHYDGSHYGPAEPGLSLAGSLVPKLKADFKYLGRWISEDGSEVVAKQRMQDKVHALCSKVDATPLRGIDKLWIYEHVIVPKMMWMLMVHDLSVSFVRHLDKLALRYVKKWMQLPRAADTTVLFTGKRRGLLRLRKLQTVYKQMQVVRLDILRQAADENVRAVFRIIGNREKKILKRVTATSLLTKAESEAKVAAAITAREPQRGLGYRQRKEKSQRKQMMEAIATADREEVLKHLDELQMQGCWRDWMDTMLADYSWKRLLYEGSDKMVLFAIKATVNVLPTRDNLRRWGFSVIDEQCPLCRYRGATLRHVLNGCKVALEQDRYTWRHNSILHEIATAVRLEMGRSPPQAREEYVHFVRPGEKPTQQRKERPALAGELHTAKDWELYVDLPNTPVVIPPDVAVTVLRPDLVLLSRQSRRLILAELTSPFEDRVQAASQLKEMKYKPLLQEAALNGWNAQLFTVEVGSRGYVAPSLRLFFKALGMPAQAVQGAIERCSRAALRCSYVIYLSRDIQEWTDRPVNYDVPMNRQASLVVVGPTTAGVLNPDEPW